MKDYYEILEVHPKASLDVIKKAYAVLAKKYHPDVTKVDPDTARSRMIEINEAYSVLSNSAEREAYDIRLANARSYSAHAQADREAAEYAREQKMRADRREFSKQVEIVSNRFENSCKYYIDLLNKRVFNSGVGNDTILLCDNLLSDFYSEVAEDYQFIENNNVWNYELRDFYGTALWWFGAGFDKGGSNEKARKVLNMAEPFMNKDFNNYNAFQQLKAKVDTEWNKQYNISSNSEVKFCRKCGRQLLPEMKFCPKCGDRIVWDNTSDSAQTTTMDSSFNKQNPRRVIVLKHESTNANPNPKPNPNSTICPSCGNSVLKWLSVCPICNQKLPDVNDLDVNDSQEKIVENYSYICPSCGRSILKGYPNCPVCNQKLSWEGIELESDENNGCVTACLIFAVLFFVFCIMVGR